MKGLRRAVFATFLVCGAFLGHEIAYALHFGVLGALTRQSTGIHRYFLPTSELAAALLLGLLSLCLVLVVLLRSVVRIRRPRPEPADVVRCQAFLFAGQLVFYVTQECIETSSARATLHDLPALLACGLVAQAVVALIGGWLFALVWAPVARHYEALAAERPAISRSVRDAHFPLESRRPPVRPEVARGHAPRAPPLQLLPSNLRSRA